MELLWGVLIGAAVVLLTQRSERIRTKTTHEIGVSVDTKDAQREITALQERAENLLKSMRKINEMAQGKKEEEENGNRNDKAIVRGGIAG